MSDPAPAQSAPLHGQHALITGAARGLGAAIAAELARLGATLSLTGRDPDALERSRARIAQLTPARIETHRLDLDTADAIADVYAAAAAVLGPPQILVNNAGMAPSAPFERMDDAVWEQTFAVNVTAPMRLARQALPAMRAAGYGRIVNVASTAALRGYPMVSAYVASKHALLGLTRALALELARTGITVNAVCPGYADTDMAAGAIENLVRAGKTEDDARRLLTRGNPQGRLVQPDEVAQAVGWLCLPGSSAVTGQAIAVAGGEVM